MVYFLDPFPLLYQDLQGRTVRVNYAHDRGSRAGAGGFGGGGGYGGGYARNSYDSGGYGGGTGSYAGSGGYAGGGRYNDGGNVASGYNTGGNYGVYEGGRGGYMVVTPVTQVAIILLLVVASIKKVMPLAYMVVQTMARRIATMEIMPLTMLLWVSWMTC
jgi:hypothetical protein